MNPLLGDPRRAGELSDQMQKIAQPGPEQKFIKITYVAGLALLIVGSLALSGHIPSIGYGGGVAMTVIGVALASSTCVASSMIAWKKGVEAMSLLEQ